MGTWLKNAQNLFIVGSPKGVEKSSFSPKGHMKLKISRLELKSPRLLSRRYTCNFLLVMAIRHPQSCSAAEVVPGCKCSQVSVVSAKCCKKFNSINILQHCPSDVVAEPSTPGYK